MRQPTPAPDFPALASLRSDLISSNSIQPDNTRQRLDRLAPLDSLTRIF